MALSEELFPQELLTLMREKRVPHAVALESPDKEVLKQSAQILAKWAVCRGEDRPCDQCVACKKVESNNHPDVYTAKPEGKKNAVKIAEIRAICADAYMMANESDCKVYIIPDADKMEASPQNAFLKLMEEPPQSILFILLCENTAGLLATIRSRCSVFKLKVNPKLQQQGDELAESIAKALCQSKESELMYACAALDERQTALKALSALSKIIRAAAAYSVTGTLGGDDVLIKALSMNVKKRGLLNMQSNISKAGEYINRNVNLSLVSATLAMNLRYSKYL